MELIDPVGYLDFLGLIARAEYILTDSGGIQEEVTAPSVNKRAFVLRTSTERPEAVESGHVSLVGVDPQRFPKAIESEKKTMVTAMRPRKSLKSSSMSFRRTDCPEMPSGAMKSAFSEAL